MRGIDEVFVVRCFSERGGERGGLPARPGRQGAEVMIDKIISVLVGGFHAIDHDDQSVAQGQGAGVIDAGSDAVHPCGDELVVGLVAPCDELPDRAELVQVVHKNDVLSQRARPAERVELRVRGSRDPAAADVVDSARSVGEHLPERAQRDLVSVQMRVHGVPAVIERGHDLSIRSFAGAQDSKPGGLEQARFAAEQLAESLLVVSFALRQALNLADQRCIFSDIEKPGLIRKNGQQLFRLCAVRDNSPTPRAVSCAGDHVPERRPLVEHLDRRQEPVPGEIHIQPAVVKNGHRRQVFIHGGRMIIRRTALGRKPVLVDI